VLVFRFIDWVCWFIHAANFWRCPIGRDDNDHQLSATAFAGLTRMSDQGFAGPGLLFWQHIDRPGQLGAKGSSRWFKHEIKPMDTVSEAILSLKPVTFRYKGDQTNTVQFGLIAEEVGKKPSPAAVQPVAQSKASRKCHGDPHGFESDSDIHVLAQF
jgi:hypothetical protein